MTHLGTNSALEENEQKRRNLHEACPHQIQLTRMLAWKQNHKRGKWNKKTGDKLGARAIWAGANSNVAKYASLNV